MSLSELFQRRDTIPVQSADELVHGKRRVSAGDVPAGAQVSALQTAMLHSDEADYENTGRRSASGNPIFLRNDGQEQEIPAGYQYYVDEQTYNSMQQAQPTGGLLKRIFG